MINSRLEDFASHSMFLKENRSFKAMKVEWFHLQREWRFETKTMFSMSCHENHVFSRKLRPRNELINKADNSKTWYVSYLMIMSCSTCWWPSWHQDLGGWCHGHKLCYVMFLICLYCKLSVTPGLDLRDLWHFVTVNDMYI